MAKSLRASSKVKARNARRYTPNTDYAVTQAARLHAISQRLAERTKGPSVSEVQNRQGQDDKSAAGVAEEEMREVEEAVETDGVDAFKAMETETGEAKKISTSGARGSRRETWRKARGWKPKKGTKNGGRPSRRK